MLSCRTANGHEVLRSELVPHRAADGRQRNDAHRGDRVLGRRLTSVGQDQQRSFRRIRSCRGDAKRPQFHSLVRDGCRGKERARIVLACADGLINTAVAQRLNVSLFLVGKWRRWFVDRGLEGLQEKPENANAWSVRRMAAAEGVSKSTVQRWFSLFAVKPHRSETFTLSSDPFFVENVHDVKTGRLQALPISR